MSVTFYIKELGLAQVDVENIYFEKNHPADPLMNPRMSRRNIYPEINLSNTNASDICQTVLNVSLDDAGWVFEWSVDKLQDCVNLINQYKPKCEPGGTEENPRKLHVLRELEFIFKTALYFRKPMVAA